MELPIVQLKIIVYQITLQHSSLASSLPLTISPNNWWPPCVNKALHCSTNKLKAKIHKLSQTRPGLTELIQNYCWTEVTSSMDMIELGILWLQIADGYSTAVVIWQGSTAKLQLLPLIREVQHSVHYVKKLILTYEYAVLKDCIVFSRLGVLLE